VRGTYNYSNKCCYKLKKDLMHTWAKENHKKMTITGMRNDEGGNRERLTCITSNGKMFHPLIVVSNEWEEQFIERERERVCKLYQEPYNFKRTGCKGCPYSLDIQEQLNIMYKLLPNEYKQCLHLWKPVYDEYIRIGYRLKYYPHEKGIQFTLEDYLEKSE
jgi:3'-phosphoadenosine 5'-phosphosulfate sulfotransferase (PAPS reductase)/FAD synthetase